MFNLNGPATAFFRAEPYPVMRNQGVSPTNGSTYEGRMAAQAALKAVGIPCTYYKYREGDDLAAARMRLKAEEDAVRMRAALAKAGVDHPIQIAEGILL